MTQGKAERYHRSMKSMVKLRMFYYPWELEQAIANFVEYHNNHRCHEALDNLTPADVCFGRGEEIQTRKEGARGKHCKTVVTVSDWCIMLYREMGAKSLFIFRPFVPKVLTTYTYMTLPPEHWTRIYSTNPLERLNREVKRRTNVMGIFPDPDAVLRLADSVLIEINDEWRVGRRYFSQQSMRKLKEPLEARLTLPSPLRLAPIR